MHVCIFVCKYVQVWSADTFIYICIHIHRRKERKAHAHNYEEEVQKIMSWRAIQHIATHCKHTATHCSILQDTAATRHICWGSVECTRKNSFAEDARLFHKQCAASVYGGIGFAGVSRVWC